MLPAYLSAYLGQFIPVHQDVARVFFVLSESFQTALDRKSPLTTTHHNLISFELKKVPRLKVERTETVSLKDFKVTTLKWRSCT